MPAPEPVRALLRSKRMGVDPTPVILLARTRGRKPIRVQETGKALAGVFGVFRHDVLDATTRRLIDPAVLAALLWMGKGPDPSGLTPEPVSARIPSTIPDVIEEPGL